MIEFMRLADLKKRPELYSTMFWDRRKQFCERLGWPLKSDEWGFEMDQYDGPEALYVVKVAENGHHAGSMRLMSLASRTMLFDHFEGTVKSASLDTATMWECTRFCTAANEPTSTALAVLTGGARILLGSKLTGLVAVFDARMERIYQRCGVPPKILGTHGYPFGSVTAGLWTFNVEAFLQLLERSGTDPDELENSLNRSGAIQFIQSAVPNLTLV